ncbi:uncharacterized protein LOC123309673 [Coccinella septempunctata]|uniref:uncharacterized protein LOC123309673 n=1 Tax=Coccinella septempunctata TaxID=41139 RepID=UPI001D088671|nr:uncharacterized protein LOC123309673 [Coccinella septempunctata]
MLVIYNGQCYDKETLLSHLNRVVEQIQSVEDVNISEGHKGCCLAKNSCRRICDKCCTLRPKLEPAIHHCCEGHHHCCGDIAPISCDIKEICDREECSNCHNHAHPTICHHHPDRKCITVHEKPHILPANIANNPTCTCCRGCMKNTCVILPQISKNSEAKHTKCKQIPCITFPEDRTEKSSPCKAKGDNFKGNPFIINENKNRNRNNNQEKHQSVAHTSSPKKCTCENCQSVRSEDMKAFDLCACNKTNGLQDHCKLCHMPRGRLGYLKTNKQAS